MSRDALRTLAAEAGIAVQGTHGFGEEQNVQDDSPRALLAALRLPAGTARECEDSLALLRTQASGAQWPPLVTGTVGRPVALPGSLRGGPHYRLQLEDGAVVEGQFKVDTKG